MVTGNFNSNIRHNNKIYHVQTEVIRGYIVTQVFDGGRIVRTEKNEHSGYADTVQQHKSVEELVKNGKL